MAMTEEKIATYKGTCSRLGGVGRVFDLSPPFQYKKTFWRRKPVYTKRIIVVEFTHWGLGGGPKTFIFPMEIFDEIKLGDRLKESVFDAWDYKRAIKNMGYEIVE